MLRAADLAVVIGGTLEAIDGALPRRPPSFYLTQVCAARLPGPASASPGRVTATSHHPALRLFLTGASCLPLQPDAFTRLLPRDFVPAELLAQEAAQQAATEQQQAAAGPTVTPAAAAGGAAAGEEGPLDCLEACCLHDDLHLFRCWGTASRQLPSGNATPAAYLAPPCCCSPLP